MSWRTVLMRTLLAIYVAGVVLLGLAMWSGLRDKDLERRILVTLPVRERLRYMASPVRFLLPVVVAWPWYWALRVWRSYAF